MKNIFKSLILLMLVSACSKTQSQSQYNFDEVGQPVVIEYAIVFNVRPVEITGRSSGASVSTPPVGAGVGSIGGAAGSYVGSEIGSIWGTGVGAAEQAAADKKGYEYTIVTEGKATKTLVQYQNPTDIVFKPGDLVMLQNTGNFHRLLSSGNLPEKIRVYHRRKVEEAQEEKEPEKETVKTPDNSKPPENKKGVLSDR